MNGWRRKALAGASAAAAAALLCACAAPTSPHRYFQPTAAQIGPAPNAYGEVVLPRGGRIVVQGDDLAYGTPIKGTTRAINGAQTGQGPLTISEDLRKVVRRIEVENRGFPGDTVVRSASRWAGAPSANLVVLAFGYGDHHAHTPIPAFASALGELIRQSHAQGAAVFVIVPPQSRDLLFNSSLEPYRAAERKVAGDQGAELFEATASEARLHPKAPLVPVGLLLVAQSVASAPSTSAKGVGQAPETYQAIAADMVPYIKVVDPAATEPPSPQTGQAGSGDSLTVRDSPASPS